MSPHGECQVDPVERDPVDPESLERREYLWLAVSDMGCPNCAHRVRNALLSVPGVLDAKIHLLAGLATVAHEETRVTTEQLIVAVERAGLGTRHDYRAEVVSAH